MTKTLLVAACVALLPATAAPAQDPSRQGELGSGLIEIPGPRRTVVLFPRGDFYPSHLAGPHQRGNSVALVSIGDTSVDAGRRAWALKLGSLFGIVRRHSNEAPERGWQIGIDAGFYGLFDIENNYDNVGWDGFYGLAYTRSLGPKLALQLGAFHTSAHVGDEFAERTGRRRLGYTREELVLGLDWAFAPRWRTYGELAHGYDLRHPAQEPGRVEWGLEHAANHTLWQERLGWYAAINLNLYEERDERPGVAIQLGLAAANDHRRWRMGVEYYDGRMPLGEFFLDDLRSWTVGLAADF